MSLFDKLNKAKMDKLKANLEEGLSFLEENKKRPEVTALQSGLQYEVIAMGEGAKVALTAFEDRMRAGPQAVATSA